MLCPVDVLEIKILIDFRMGGFGRVLEKLISSG